jgi:hypothetical protein
MNFVAFFLVGALTSFAILVAGLRFYVDVGNPYLIYAASFIALELIVLLIRMVRGKATSLLRRSLSVLSEGAVFVIGAWASLYGLLSIYPPNN